MVPARLGPGFRWLLASSWVSNLGDGLMTAAGPLLVASQTHNPVLVAAAAMSSQLPLAAVRAGRWRPRGPSRPAGGRDHCGLAAHGGDGWLVRGDRDWPRQYLASDGVYVRARDR